MNQNIIISYTDFLNERLNRDEKNFNKSGHTNKKMDDKVYKERRIVMDSIYRAKNLLKTVGIDMPRVDVRVTTTDDKNDLGIAKMNGKLLAIPDSKLVHGHAYQVVLHELCHALWGIPHDDKCKLMSPYLNKKVTDEEAEEIFIKYAKKHAANK